jgi:hypothetical protein
MTAPDLSRIEQLPPGDIRGWLAINNLPPELQRAEDSTAMADKARHRLLNPRGHEREATATERILLQYLGFELPEQLTTKVTWPSRSVRRRTWPVLESRGVAP